MKRSFESDIPKLSQQLDVCYYEQFETAEQKAQRNRDRNKEHAKKTRLRKKEMLENVKNCLLELQQESSHLEKLLEESNTANILLSLGSSMCSSNHDADSLSSEVIVPESVFPVAGNVVEQLRLQVKLEYNPYGESAEHNLNDDENEGGEDEESSSGSPAEDGNLEMVLDRSQQRRARNRVHAKLTRDRKKLFVARMLETIEYFKVRNADLRNQLSLALKGPSCSTSTKPIIASASSSSSSSSSSRVDLAALDRPVELIDGVKG